MFDRDQYDYSHNTWCDEFVKTMIHMMTLGAVVVHYTIMTLCMDDDDWFVTTFHSFREHHTAVHCLYRTDRNDCTCSLATNGQFHWMKGSRLRCNGRVGSVCQHHATYTAEAPELHQRVPNLAQINLIRLTGFNLYNDMFWRYKSIETCLMWLCSPIPIYILPHNIRSLVYCSLVTPQALGLGPMTLGSDSPPSTIVTWATQYCTALIYFQHRHGVTVPVLARKV